MDIAVINYCVKEGRKNRVSEHSLYIIIIIIIVIVIMIIIIIYPLTARVVGTQQMISQPVSSIFVCSPLPSGIWRSPGRSIP